jgi:hypothetical protein
LLLHLTAAGKVEKDSKRPTCEMLIFSHFISFHVVYYGSTKYNINNCNNSISFVDMEKKTKDIKGVMANQLEREN